MKIKAFLLTLTILSAANAPANASPVTYTGSKGQYTVDREAGTYNGCIKRDCISLGPNQKDGPSSWRNGDYAYFINDFRVSVYQNGELIFEDSFKKVGECVKSSVLETQISRKAYITFVNGISLVSYDNNEPGIKLSKAGDPVRICLTSIPKNCPRGDDRGREYTVTNLRTNKKFTLPDSPRSCGT